VLGIRYNGAATAFVTKDVRQAGIVQVTVGGVPIVLASLRSTCRSLRSNAM
jgi:hypothetical protein